MLENIVQLNEEVIKGQLKELVRGSAKEILNVFYVTLHSKVKLVAQMCKAIHAREGKKTTREKAKAVLEELCSTKLREAAKKVADAIEETLTYRDFPGEH